MRRIVRSSVGDMMLKRNAEQNDLRERDDPFRNHPVREYSAIGHPFWRGCHISLCSLPEGLGAGSGVACAGPQDLVPGVPVRQVPCSVKGLGDLLPGQAEAAQRDLSG